MGRLPPSRKFGTLDQLGLEQHWHRTAGWHKNNYTDGNGLIPWFFHRFLWWMKNYDSKGDYVKFYWITLGCWEILEPNNSPVPRTKARFTDLWQENTWSHVFYWMERKSICFHLALCVWNSRSLLGWNSFFRLLQMLHIMLSEVPKIAPRLQAEFKISKRPQSSTSGFSHAVYRWTRLSISRLEKSILGAFLGEKEALSVPGFAEVSSQLRGTETGPGGLILQPLVWSEG